MSGPPGVAKPMAKPGVLRLRCPPFNGRGVAVCDSLQPLNWFWGNGIDVGRLEFFMVARPLRLCSKVDR